MKKKKQQQKTTPLSGTATTPGSADLKTLIHAHSVFFDKLIELIPAKFYVPPNDDVSNDPKPYFHGLSKAAKASFKRQSKQNLIFARRNRLDPEKIPHSSTLDLLQQSLQSNARTEITQVPPEAEDGNLPASKSIDLEENDGAGGKGQKTVTYEELREKLRKKIESLRGNRGEGNRNVRKGREDNESHRETKRKRGGEGGGSSIRKDVNPRENDCEEVIEYGKVKISDDEIERKTRKKKRKMSKVKELDRVKRLDEVKRENPRVAEREWWRAAENRAMGVKVHDDPKLLRESMKKEKKRKEKNAEKWKDRIESKEKAKEERQQKRKENIEGRIRDKKMRKIAKREKKLMRPGFEGRKDEYITKD